MFADDHTRCEYDQLFRRVDAARYVEEAYFPCSPKTLAKLACVSSQGPPFRKAGRIPLYPKSGLDEWAQSKIGPLVRSTSEYSVRREKDIGRLLNERKRVSEITAQRSRRANHSEETE
jgi:hypothetical protein